MEDRKDALLVTAIFNIALPLIPLLGALLSLALLHKGLTTLAADGSLILASIAVAGGTVPVALPLQTQSSLGRLRFSAIGLSLLFCVVSSIVYGSVYNDLGHGGEREMDLGFLAKMSVTGVAFSILLALLLVQVRPSSPPRLN